MGQHFSMHSSKGFITPLFRISHCQKSTANEVLRRMRLIDPEVPAIAFTAHAGSNYRQRAIEAGFNDVATKPIQDMDAFCRMIIEIAERRAA